MSASASSSTRPDPTREPSFAFIGSEHVYIAALDRLSERARLIKPLKKSDTGMSGHEVAMSPDGRHVAFYRSHPNTLAWNRRCLDGSIPYLKAVDERPLCNDLMIMRTDGTGLRVLATNASGGATFSPDGKRVVYVDQRCAMYVSVGRDSSLKTGPQSCGYFMLGLSVVDTDGSNRRILLRPKRHWLVEPDWSPDGKLIVFGRWPIDEMGGDMERSELWIMQADGSRPRFLTRSKCRGISEPRFSPDSGHVAFNAEDVCMMLAMGLVDVDGRNRRSTTGPIFAGGWASPKEPIVQVGQGKGWVLARWNIDRGADVIPVIPNSFFPELVTTSIVSRISG